MTKSAIKAAPNTPSTRRNVICLSSFGELGRLGRQLAELERRKSRTERRTAGHTRNVSAESPGDAPKQATVGPVAQWRNQRHGWVSVSESIYAPRCCGWRSWQFPFF